jgi:hypothetical protein
LPSPSVEWGELGACGHGFIVLPGGLNRGQLTRFKPVSQVGATDLERVANFAGANRSCIDPVDEGETVEAVQVSSCSVHSNGRQRLMNVNATRDSSDGVLRVKLVEHDPRTGNGQIQIIELRQEHARYYVTVLYGSGQQRIDYKTYDLMKATVFAFQARPNEDVTDVTIVAVPAD